MLIEVLRPLFKRDLKKLIKELDAYQSESAIWKVENGILNSAGNLCLHLVGNLNTYIGTNLGDSGYQRNRELEFSQKDVPREELIAMLQKTISIVDSSLAKLNEEDLGNDYPEPVLGETNTTGFFLVHLVAHLSWHLGQINYHRKLLDN